MKEFIAGGNDAGMRLSRFVLRVTHGLPQSLMHKGFRNRRIKVNGKRAAADYCLQEGDAVQLYLNDEFFGQEKLPYQPHPAADLPSFATEYEDENIAVLYKPAGVLSHRDEHDGLSLLDAYTDLLVRQCRFDPAAENTFSPALCNRLDRGTEGLVLVAKNAAALREMNESIRENRLVKTYLCVCLGKPPKGVFHAWHKRDLTTHTVTVASDEFENSKPITTEFLPLEEKDGLCLCEVILHTGRTHQIRAHLAFLGSPILGDAKYGNTAANKRHRLDAQLLCASKLSFLPLQTPELAYLSGTSHSATRSATKKWWNSL